MFVDHSEYGSREDLPHEHQKQCKETSINRVLRSFVRSSSHLADICPNSRKIDSVDDVFSINQMWDLRLLKETVTVTMGFLVMISIVRLRFCSY